MRESRGWSIPGATGGSSDCRRRRYAAAAGGGLGRQRLGAAWGGIIGLYKARPNTGSAGAELLGLVFAAEDLLAEGKHAPALEALTRAEGLLEDLGVEAGPPADGEGG